METILIIVALIGGIAGGFGIAKFLEKSNISNMVKNAKKEAASILKDANLEAENIKKDKLLQAKEKFLELKSEHEQEILNKDKRIAEIEKRTREKFDQDQIDENPLDDAPEYTALGIHADDFVPEDFILNETEEDKRSKEALIEEVRKKYSDARKNFYNAIEAAKAARIEAL